MKKCPKCNQIKPLTEFHKGPAYCKPCRKIYDKARKGRNGSDIRRNNTDAARARKRRWLKTHLDPMKESARQQVHRAIKVGALVPEVACQECGHVAYRRDGKKAIQAHHHLGYQFPLSVVWLCPKCHTKADAALSQEQATPRI